MALGNSSGVPQAIATDMALIGDTSMELQTKSLPKSFGPNFGAKFGGGGSEERNQGGSGPGGK